MKNLYLVIGGFFIVMLSGCIDVKIKSEIPKKIYYDLDTQELSTRVCSQFHTVVLGGVTSVSSFDVPKVIKKQSNGEIEPMGNLLWVDNPKEMIRNILIKNALSQCVNLDSGIEKTDLILSIKVLFLGFLDNQAVVELAYRVSDSRMNTLKMGVIKKDKPSQEIAALQTLSQEAVSEIISLLK